MYIGLLDVPNGSRTQNNRELAKETSSVFVMFP